MLNLPGSWHCCCAPTQAATTNMLANESKFIFGVLSAKDHMHSANCRVSNRSETHADDKIMFSDLIVTAVAMCSGIQGLSSHRLCNHNRAWWIEVQLLTSFIYLYHYVYEYISILKYLRKQWKQTFIKFGIPYQDFDHMWGKADLY